MRVAGINVRLWLYWAESSDGVAHRLMGISFHKSSAISGQSFSPRTLQLLDQAGNFVFGGPLIWWFGGGAWKATA